MPIVAGGGVYHHLLTLSRRALSLEANASVNFTALADLSVDNLTVFAEALAEIWLEGPNEAAYASDYAVATIGLASEPYAGVYDELECIIDADTHIVADIEAQAWQISNIELVA